MANFRLASGEQAYLRQGSVVSYRVLGAVTSVVTTVVEVGKNGTWLRLGWSVSDRVLDTETVGRRVAPLREEHLRDLVETGLWNHARVDQATVVAASEHLERLTGQRVWRRRGKNCERSRSQDKIAEANEKGGNLGGNLGSAAFSPNKAKGKGKDQGQPEDNGTFPNKGRGKGQDKGKIEDNGKGKVNGKSPPGSVESRSRSRDRRVFSNSLRQTCEGLVLDLSD